MEQSEHKKVIHVDLFRSLAFDRVLERVRVKALADGTVSLPDIFPRRCRQMIGQTVDRHEAIIGTGTSTVLSSLFDGHLKSLEWCSLERSLILPFLVAVFHTCELRHGKIVEHGWVTNPT